MKITNIKQNINFKSGLSSNIIQKYNNTSIEKVESILRQYNIKADFENNQTVAFSTINAIEIINNLKNKLNFLLLSIPQIGLYSKQDLIFNFQGYGFCIPETQLVLKNKFPALTGSIFYEKEERIEALNSKLDMSFIWYVFTYNNERRKYIVDILDKSNKAKILTFQKQSDLDNWVRQKFIENNININEINK